MSLLPFYDVETPATGTADRLVVVCHGFGKRKEYMLDIVAAIKQELPSAAIMNVEHAGRDMFTNADPIAVADTLNAAIGAAYDDLKVARVTLVGHSIGALLLRKAYVFARGFNQDSISPVAPHEWSQHVDNMIFLAAFNRGISIREKTPERSYALFYLIRFAYTLSRIGRFAGFVRRFERGGRFVSNLRLQWLAALPPNPERARYRRGHGIRRSSDAAVAMWRPSGDELKTLQVNDLPPVTQLVGIEDEYIGGNESNDLEVCGSFVRKNVPNTNHATIVEFPKTSDGNTRRTAFVQALLHPTIFDSPELPGANVDRVVFVMHGIRDYGFWVPGLARRVVRSGKSMGGVNVETITSSYGYFSMLSFILWSDRQRNVRWFMDELTEAVARYPNAVLDFVGHSNGTYLLASALLDYAATRFNNVVLAGSVVRRDFPWDSLKVSKRVNAVRNYVGSADWVVGFLPHFFEFVGDLLNKKGSRYFDIGGAGFLGFTSSVTAKDQVMFIRGDHGAAIAPENWRSIARFIIDPTTQTAQSLTTRTQSGAVALGARLCWAIWLVGAIVLIGFIGATAGLAFVAWHNVILAVLCGLAALAIVFLMSESV